MKIKLKTWFVIFGSLLSISSAAEEEKHLTSELFNEIFKDYHKEVFPIDQNESSSDKTLQVKFGLALINLDFNEETSTVILNAWNRMLWTDPRLTYNGTVYGRTALRLYTTLLWTPDITLYNSNDFVTPPFPAHYHALIYPNGEVLWVPPSTYKAHCDEDLTDWPWDTQTCTLKFGSWVHSDFSMDLQFYNDQQEIDISDYKGKSRWTVKQRKGKKDTKTYACCEEPYSSLNYELVIQRQASGKSYMFMAPTLVVILLTLFIFLMPPTSPERLTIAFINTVVIVLHLLYIAMSLPLRNEPPKIATVLVASLVIVTITVFFTVVTNCALRSQTQWMPTRFISNLIAGPVGSILLVATIKKRSGDTMQLQEEGNAAADYTDSTSYQEAYQFFSFLDRISFIFYSIVFIGLLMSLF